MHGRYYGTGFEPSGDYPNLLGITPADRRPKLEEYNIDLGDPFGEKTVYIKTQMRLEDFDMALSEDFIRSNIQICTAIDAITYNFKITASFKLPFGPEFKTTECIMHFTAIAKNEEIQNVKNKLVDTLVHKVQTYYEGRIVKENMMNMNMYAMNDEICEYLGLPTKTPEKKSKWIERLPAVKKVETYNQRVVKVTFIDDTFTKAVCSENDHFDLDVGITICAMKRLLGTNSDDATREYNRFINHVHKVINKNEKEKLEAKTHKSIEKDKKRKAELKKAANKLKAKEEQIDIQKQAIIRAQKEMEAME